MASRISGITIEINGDTTKLQTALRSVDTQLKTTQTSLKDIDRLLKFSPTSTELLTQKQKNLKSAISDTKSRLQQLKDAQSSVAKGTDEWDKLQREIIATEQDLKKLESEYRSFGSVAKQQIQAVGEKMKTIGTNMQNVGKNLTQSVTLPIVAGFTAAVKTTADFDSSMSQVAATMGTTTDKIANLRDYAREMGSTTAFSASEAAEAMNYMALAGYDTEEIMSMLPTVLDLAAAGNIDLASASDMVTDAQSALGLSAEETVEMVDQMAAASSHSNTSVSQLGEAMLKIGATARNVKGGTQELSTVLGVLADNGIKGSEGGTHLRNILLSLQESAENGAVAFGDFSVDIYDADGNMRSMIDIIEDVQTGLGDMSQESKDAIISGVFNKTDLAAVNALLGTSAERFDELGNAISNSSGAAGTMADTQLDNLSGQLTLLKSAVQELAIGFGDALMPTIRKVVSWIQSLVEKFNALSPATKETIAKVAAVAAAIGPLLLIGGKLISGIGSIMSAVSLLFSPMGLIVVAIAAVVAAGVLLYKNWDKIKAFAKKFATALKKTWKDLKKNLVDAVENIKDKTVNAWNTIKTKVTNFANNLKTAVVKAWTTLKTTVVNTVNNLKTTVVNTWNNLKTTVVNTVNNLKTSVSTAWTNLKTAVVNTVNSLKTSVSTAWTNLKTAVVNTVNNLKSTVSTTWENLKSAVTTTVSNLEKGISDAWDSIKKTAYNKALSISNTLQGAWEEIKNYVQGKIEDLRDGLWDVWEEIKSHASSAASAIKEAFNFRVQQNLIDTGNSWGVESEAYAKGYHNPVMFTSPTVLATPAGYKTFGDGNGAEIVMGLNKLRELVGGTSQGDVVINVYASQGMDVNALAEKIQTRFVQLQKQRSLAYA